MGIQQRPSDPSPLPVSRWLACLGEEACCPFPDVYGNDPAVWARRRVLLRGTLERYRGAFDDGKVRVFRAPGRINLRGMHVDTHGGFLNLMTHDREVVVVAAASPDEDVRFVNTAPEHQDIAFSLRYWQDRPALGVDWARLIASPEADTRRVAWGGGRGAYVEGAMLRAAHAMPALATSGLRAAVGSDLPAGAALSSSAALGVAVLMAALGSHDARLSPDERIHAARDAEWFTGSRCGLSDQAAIVLGRRGQYVHVALSPSEPALANAVHAALPDNVTVLVADSRTVRSISGAQKIGYTRNRFAYSMALEILRHEMASMDYPPECVDEANRLSRITPERLGGDARLYELLLRIPEAISLDELHDRYALPSLDAAFRQYFGDMPPEAIGGAIALRGPLLFGLAESERARLWPLALQQGDVPLAGRLMTIGHDGDRVVDGNGATLRRPVDDATLQRLIAEGIPIALCPGDYGASTPVLDGLVDAALTAGALGASLTGAGLAGCVIALCESSHADVVAEGMRRWLASPDYAARAGRQLGADEIQAAVVTNHATAGASELVLEA